MHCPYRPQWFQRFRTAVSAYSLQMSRRLKMPIETPGLLSIVQDHTVGRATLGAQQTQTVAGRGSLRAVSGSGGSEFLEVACH